MKAQELRPSIGLFGAIKAIGKVDEMTVHGVLRDVSPKGNLVYFVDNEGYGHAFLPKNVKSFELKEFEGFPKEHKGREIYWTGGEAYYKDDNKKCELNK